MAVELTDTLSGDPEVIEAAWDDSFNGRMSPAYRTQRKLEIHVRQDEIVDEEDEQLAYPNNRTSS